MSFEQKTTRVQVKVRPDWCPKGEMLVIDAQEIAIRFDPAPFIEEEGPHKIILVHDEREAFRIRETLLENDGFELIEDEDSDPA